MKDYKKILNSFKRINNKKYYIYYNSVSFNNGNLFFMVKDKREKFLIILEKNKLIEGFDCISISNIFIDGTVFKLRILKLTHNNLKILSKIFSYINPSVCNKGISFGLGDRLGVATPAHIEAIKDKNIFPVLAQQSVRELNKTGRSWQDVINDAVWGVFEAGYKKPFGADADHVKEIADLDDAIKNGFTMFTIDPSDFILTGSDRVDKNKISKKYDSIAEKKEIERLYLGKKITINGKDLEFDLDSLKFVEASYLEAIKHVVICYKFIMQNKKNDFDFEVSMDEVDSAISPLAHLFIVSELQRNEVNFHNIALRYPGSWEKAIDYIGDIKEFKQELKMHAGIAKNLGGYKLSLHSGSEKFSTYKIFSEETGGLFHIKTSGTSWLESLRTIAIKNPELFKDIYDYAVKRYEEEKKSYHISTMLLSIPDISKFEEDKFENLLGLNRCRQMLHVTFGTILTARKSGVYAFKNSIYETLFANESLHYKYVKENIDRHLNMLNI